MATWQYATLRLQARGGGRRQHIGPAAPREWVASAHEHELFREDALELALDRLGSEGWEMVSAQPFYVFKRSAPG
jgi:hypothetical protein